MHCITVPVTNRLRLTLSGRYRRTAEVARRTSDPSACDEPNNGTAELSTRMSMAVSFGIARQSPLRPMPEIQRAVDTCTRNRIGASLYGRQPFFKAFRRAIGLTAPSTIDFGRL